MNKATSRSAVISLLRFLYTGTYLIDQEECLGSLLPHAEAYKIAEDFDCPELQVQAYVNFSRDIEFACCKAAPPSDLCATIQFLYRHLAGAQSQEQHSLLDTLLNYCVSVFTYQKLDTQEDFRQTVYENPDFHQDLCKTSLKRDFDVDGASEIMKLPICRPTPHSQVALLKRALGDFLYEIWQEGEDPISEVEKAERCLNPAKKRKPSHGTFALVHRPKNADGNATCSSDESGSDSSSGEHTLVYRPKDAVIVANSVDNDSESEYSCDEDGYKLVHQPKPEREIETASSRSQICGDVLGTPGTCFSPPVMVSQEPKDEAVGMGSDDEWALI